MRGLTFHGDQDVCVEDVPDAQIQKPTEAVVKVTMAGICGSDLHILNAGTAFGFEPGSRLGHEFIGTVEEVGAEVTNLRPGDRVLASCSVLDGSCPMCHEHLHSSCNSWSLFGWAPRTWQHDGSVQGGQSEYVRVPLASTTLIPMPEELAGMDRQKTMLPLVDVMSTAWHGLRTAGMKPGFNVVADVAPSCPAMVPATARPPAARKPTVRGSRVTPRMPGVCRDGRRRARNTCAGGQDFTRARSPER